MCICGALSCGGASVGLGRGPRWRANECGCVCVCVCVYNDVYDTVCGIALCVPQAYDTPLGLRCRGIGKRRRVDG